MAVLNKILREYSVNRKMRLWIAGRIIGPEITSTTAVTLEEWRAFRDAAYPNWRDGDWTLSDEMKARLRRAAWDYEKEERK